MILTLRKIISLISDARDTAEAEAKQDYPMTQSRGVEIIAEDAQGNRTTHDAYEVFGSVSMKQIQRIITDNPEATTLTFQGGFKGAESFRHMHEYFEYDSFASEWAVTLPIHHGKLVSGCCTEDEYITMADANRLPDYEMTIMRKDRIVGRYVGVSRAGVVYTAWYDTLRNDDARIRDAIATYRDRLAWNKSA
jgi:hypothetical protein